MLDEASLRLAVAVQNLLFLAHPGAQGLPVTQSRRHRVAQYAAQAATLPEPGDLGDLVARHSMIHHIFDLGRDDVRVSFWAGRREYRGAGRPAVSSNGPIFAACARSVGAWAWWRRRSPRRISARS